MTRPRVALRLFPPLLLLGLLLAGFPPASAEPGSRQARKVLILHSYQEGPAWVEHVSEGILSVLNAATDFDWVYRFEYMNVLDADPAEYPEVYRRRLAGLRFDLVITVDNQALEFAVSQRQRFFAGVPVVFCSIDNYSEALLKGQRGITGVVGRQDFLSTLMLAWRLHPGFQHLLVLVNREVVAERAAYRQLARLIQEKLPRDLDVRFWEDPKLSEVLQGAQALSPQTVVLAQAFFTGDDNRPLSLPASARLVSEALQVPMYSCWETLLGNGIVGGMITGGFQQGEVAAQLALRILRGEPVEAIPVVQQSPNRYMFDYPQLKRFRIPLSQLPSGSIILNKPVSFYERHRDLIWVGAAVFAALSLLLALSWVYALVQRRLRRSVRESEERLASALEATGSGIWEYDPHTGAAHFDPRWFGMLGYAPDTFPHIYETWTNLLHPDDRAQTEEEVRRHVQEGSDFTIEFRMRTHDGRWRWISSSGRIVERDTAGRALRLVGTHVDITERKEAEEALRESARRYQFLYEKSPSISLVIDLEGRIRDVNGSFVDALGYTKEQIIDQPALELVVPAQRERVAAQLAKDLQGMYTPQIDVDVVAKDGSIRTVLFSDSSAMLYDGERPTGVLVTGLDITERRTAMEQARQQQQQLIQADKLASLGILVSGVAHEINNPNNYILLNGRICSRVWDDVQPILRSYYEQHGDFLLGGMPYSEAQPKIGKLIAGIAEGAQRIKQIVLSLRDFARKDAGDLTQPLDINGVVEAATILLHNLIEKSTNRFIVEYAQGLPLVRGNAQQLEQVLINLITNACQALPDRDRGITVSTRFDQESRRLAISVQDQGTGIGEEDLKKIMDPFFTTKQAGGGTGLGLSISYNILKNHGGDLMIQSRLGEGTTATVILPIRAEGER